MFFLTHPVPLSVSIETCDSMKLGWIHTSASWIYSSVFSSKANYETGPLGHRTTAHCCPNKGRGERKHQLRRGEPRPPGLSPPPYLLKLSWFGSGPTGPSFTPRFPLLHTQKQHAAQEVSCSSRLTNMYILNRPAHAHTREVNNPPWSVWPVGEVKPMGMFPIEGFTQWCKLLVHPILVVRKFAS